jgi:hypothetical protein
VAAKPLAIGGKGLNCLVTMEASDPLLKREGISAALWAQAEAMTLPGRSGLLVTLVWQHLEPLQLLGELRGQD